MSTRNSNLKTVCKPITEDTASITVGGQVPTGMTRWVTFVQCDSTSVAKRCSSFALVFASVGVANPTVASINATGNRKFACGAVGTQVSRSNARRPLTFPSSGPNPENPLFSIAGGKYLGVSASVTTAMLFLQYFDE